VDESTFTIGEIARLARLNVSAIRYYEARGLLPEALRIAGQRRYGVDTLNRLGVIDIAKRAGFSLDEIRVLLDASDKGEPAHGQLRELADRKLHEVDEMIRRAQAVRGWLETAMTCGCDTFEACVLFSDPPAHLDGFAIHSAS
jgi:MerR family transcriptional regulator, redox-sensitive transcriptional activator SoxR